MNIFGKEEEPQINDAKVISNSLGIDLGTLNTVIAKPSGDKFDLYQIPSVVAVKKDDPSEVLAVGEEAKKMLGRTPEDILDFSITDTVFLITLSGATSTIKLGSSTRYLRNILT